MSRIIFGLLSIFALAGSVNGLELSSEIDREIENEMAKFIPANVSRGLLSSDDGARSVAVFPLGYEVISNKDGSAYVHYYSDAYVVTLSSGYNKGAQGVFTYNGVPVVLKSKKDATDTVGGKKYDVYFYGSEAIYHSGKDQFAYSL